MQTETALPVRSSIGARHAITTLVTVGALATTFLPWARSGERARNSYELVDVAERAGVIPDGWVASLAPIWFLVPIVCAFVLFSFFAPVRRLPGLLTAMVGGSEAIFAVLVLRSPLVATNGGRVAVLVGAATLSWGLIQLISPVKKERHQPNE